MNTRQYCHLDIMWMVCFLSFISIDVYAADDRQTGNLIGTASQPYMSSNGGNPILFPSKIGNQQQLSGIGANAFVPNIYANFGPNDYGGRYGSSMYQSNGYLSRGHYWPQAAYYGAQRAYNRQPGVIAALPYGVSPYAMQQYTALQGNRGLQVNPEPYLLPRAGVHAYTNKRPLR